MINPRCPHCGKFLFDDRDIVEKYWTCPACAREYDYSLRPRRMTMDELTKRCHITLVSGNVR